MINNTQLFKVALQNLNAGLYSIPLNAERIPLVKWKQLNHDEPPTKAMLEQWFNKPCAEGLAILTGKASRDMLALDFDVKHFDDPEMYPKFKERLLANDFPLYKFNLIPIIRTKSGGYHWYVRCCNPGQNTVYARNKEGAPMLETRANGGLVFAPPTMGYELVNEPLFIPQLDDEDVAILINTAKSFDLAPPALPPRVKRPRIPVLCYSTDVQFNHDAAIYNADTKFARCVFYTLRKYSFVAGCRNTFTFHLACKCRFFGMEEQDALSNILFNFCYSEKEVRAAVKSAYRYK